MKGGLKMTLNQLTYFRKIAQLEHFSRASEELHISQPSLSRSMEALERELGLPLFEKQGRNIILTKYGRIFLTHAERILDEVAAAERKMQYLTQGGGHVDIAYVSPLANHYIPHTVRSFLNLEENKNVTFSFSQARTSDLIAGLKNDTYDVVFGAYVEDQPSIHFTPILKQQMIIITSLNHPLAGKESVPFDVLGEYPVIGYDYNSGLGLYTKKLYRQHHITPALVIDCPDEYSIAALVAEDFGIALVADVDTIRDARISRIAVKGEQIVHKVHMAYMKNKYLIPAANRFLKFVQKQAGI